jgi:hypothetical protein
MHLIPPKIYNRGVMKNSLLLLVIALSCLIACNKSSAPASSSNSSLAKADAVQQKLQYYAGTSSTDCGRLDVHAAEAQSKIASDCALQANQGKHPFYVAYDMPGMTVGVAGNSEGKLFTVQSQGGAVTSGDCPSQLRVASSGRITCFAPGDMGSMSGHAAGTVPPGMDNPHAAGAQNPHGAAKPPSN